MRTIDQRVINKLIDELWAATMCQDGTGVFCPAHAGCRAKHDLNLLGGTECTAILRTWAYDTVREEMTRDMKTEDMCVCLIGDQHGIYIPQIFAEEPDWWEKFNLPTGPGSAEMRTELTSGPDNEYYWDTWTQVLDSAWHEDPETGLVWRLYQDGDLFMVVDGYLERFAGE